jgi:lipoprotein-releasing system ATP-binding protein
VSAPVLEAVDLGRTFRSGAEELHVLRGVELSVAAGEVVAIVGPSGSGKSTLLHLLGTLDRPTTGEVRLGGAPTATLSDRALSVLRNKLLGFVFQFHHLLPEFTALENVMMPGLLRRMSTRQARMRAFELLEAVGVHERAAHRPAELSGGERQRVAVARALFNDPHVVLADEPSGDLDRDRAEALHHLLLSLPRERGAALVVATHNEDLARSADRVLSLCDGRLHGIK